MRFSEPKDQDEKIVGEKPEGGQDTNDSPRDTGSASETNGSGIAPEGSNGTGFTLDLKQVR
jgi:hypothetical protein